MDLSQLGQGSTSPSSCPSHKAQFQLAPLGVPERLWDAAGRLEAGKAEQLLQSSSPFQGNRQMKGKMLCNSSSLLGNGTSRSSLSSDAEKFK